VLDTFAKQIDEWETANSQYNALSKLQSRTPQITVKMQELRDIFSKQLNLGSTPLVMQKLGADKLPMIISPGVVEKVTGGTDFAHTLSLDELKKLPSELADPIMVFNSDTDKGTTRNDVPRSLVVLTALTNEQGHEVVAAVHLNKRQGFTEINDIASVHSRTNTETGKNQIVTFVKTQLKAGNLRYIDKNKSDEWLRSRGVQFPELNTILASNNNILRKKDIVNSILPKNQNANTKIKYSLEDVRPEVRRIIEELIKDYGVIAPGEKPAREVKVPRRTADNLYVSHFARTAMEAEATPDWAVSEFEQAIVDGSMSHMRHTDKKALKFARDKINDLGFDGALNYWNTLVDSQHALNKNDMALGMELYNQSINAKDAATAMKVAVDLADEATRAGQNIQAIRLLKQFSPDAQLYSLEKSVQSINREMKENYPDVEINKDLARKLLDATTEAERVQAINDLQEDIARQIPATLMDKWNAWRYLSMLGNPTTHIRNIAGNIVFIPAVKMKNYIGAALEQTLPQEQRTKAFATSKAAREFARKDFENIADTVRGNVGKYQTINGIEDRRTIFKTRWLEFLRKANFKLLEGEDAYFLRRAYIDSLAQFITARGITPEFLAGNTAKGHAALEAAREYATNEAQKATYRDMNKAAQLIAKAQRKLMKSNLTGKTAGVLIEGVLPFKSTPMNILRRGIEYSPLEFLKVVGSDIHKVRNGQMTADAMIDDISKGLTGTAIMLLGMFLARLGLIRGSEDEDGKKADFDSMSGIQPYALNLFGHTFTINWMAPAALPLFIGVELANAFESDGVTFGEAIDAAAKISEPMLELSMLQGISRTLTTAQYSDTNPISAVFFDAAANYFSQAVPSVSGKLARTIDGVRRSTYIDKNSVLPVAVDRLIQQTEAKIPFLSMRLQPRLDVWGREISGGESYLSRAAENFLSPGYLEKLDDGNVTRELNRLYAAEGDNAVFPAAQAKTITVKGKTVNLTGSQYTWLAKRRGELSLKNVDKLTRSSGYKKAKDANKIKQIKKAYDDARDKAKDEFIEKSASRR
jgi:hypothetical protein